MDAKFYNFSNKKNILKKNSVFFLSGSKFLVLLCLDYCVFYLVKIIKLDDLKICSAFIYHRNEKFDDPIQVQHGIL